MNDIDIDTYIRISKITNNALHAKTYIDSKYRIGQLETQQYINHIKDCIENPTTGLLANRDFFDNRTLNNPRKYYRNIKFLYKQPEVISIHKQLHDKLNLLYPKTLKAREFLIDNNCVSLNYLRPIKHNLRRYIFKTFHI